MLIAMLQHPDFNNYQLSSLKFVSSGGAPVPISVMEQIKAGIPEGAPVAWFPPRIQDFFKRQGIERVATRLNNEMADKDLPGFRRLFWSIDLPKIGFPEAIKWRSTGTA